MVIAVALPWIFGGHFDVEVDYTVEFADFTGALPPWLEAVILLIVGGVVGALLAGWITKRDN